MSIGLPLAPPGFNKANENAFASLAALAAMARSSWRML
jgi:hypothetical protein